MPFRNKDLLVTLLPQMGIKAEEFAKVCIWRTTICRFPTLPCIRPWTGWCGRCTLLMTEMCRRPSLECPRGSFVCPGGSLVCDPTPFCPGGSDPFIIDDLQDLVTLKGELKAALKQLDEMETSGLASGFQSKAEAEEMESELAQRLEAVRAIKKNLK